jgi:hypothetical protein
MELVKVLVRGELPRTCLACDLFIVTQYEGFDWCPFQRYAEEKISITYYDKLAKKGERPSWCPLEIESEE